MAFAESWHVRSRSRECAATQQPFADGNTIITALFPDPESSGYLRRDYSLEGWESLPADAETPFSFSKSHYAAPGGEETVNPMEKLSAEEAGLHADMAVHDQSDYDGLAKLVERQSTLNEKRESLEIEWLETSELLG